MSRRKTSVVTAAVVVVLLVGGLLSAPAQAWKPFTHNYTGSRVLDDLADGRVTIAGHEYTVTGAVGDAITSWQSYYNAGVVGPDGFPDIAFGQSTIHPGDPVSTGSWLGYLLQQAWAAQAPNSGYSDDERGQILAFTYGFLTHAAGDTWAHTLMNDYAGGVFPSVKEVLTKVPAAQIALRHLITEAYIGAATGGVDAPNAEDAVGTCDDADVSGPDTICNPGTSEQTYVELSHVCSNLNLPPNAATSCWTDGPGGSRVPDYSANSTPGIAYDVPGRFLQRTMIDLTAHTPADGCDHNGDGDHGCPNGQYDPDAASQLTRGPLMDLILDQQAKLQIAAAKERFDADNTMCTTVDPDCYDRTTTLTVHTVRGFASVDVPDTICKAKVFCVASPADLAGDVVDGLIANYLEAWSTDIDAMRDHWSDFSLAVTKGLFDPQTRRDAANDDCRFSAVGGEGLFNNARNSCEAGVGAIDSVFYSLSHVYSSGDPSFITRYLVPALGFPDAVGDIAAFLKKVGDAIDSVFEFIGVTNPLAQISADVHAFVMDKINGWLDDEYGISPDAIEQFSATMSQWMCGEDENNPASITLPGIGKITPGGLFTPEEHARLDALLHLPADHHQQQDGLPLECSPLKTGVTFDPTQFAPLKNTVTMSKLLLLNGSQLDSVLGTTLADAGVVKDASVVQTYGGTSAGFPANVMVDGMTGSGAASHTSGFGGLSTSLPWLHLIDGDHAWRSNGLPRFCDNDGTGHCAGPVPAGLDPTPRALPGSGPVDLSGQTNGGNGNFPLWTSCLLRPAFRTLFTDWENGVSNFPDLGDAPTPDASAPNAPSVSQTLSGAFTHDGTSYLGAANTVTLAATDDVFTDGQLALRFRVVPAGTTAGPDEGWQSIANGGQFAVAGDDGAYRIEYQAEDPCHTFDAGDALDSPVHSTDVVLDTTAPTVTITSPNQEGKVYDTAAVRPLTFTASDAGSSVTSTKITIDGHRALPGVTLDMFYLSPGAHAITVRATDGDGNGSVARRSFVVQPSTTSLTANVTRARTLGLIQRADVLRALRTTLTHAQWAHRNGHHDIEATDLRTFVLTVTSHRNNGIEQGTAARLARFAADVIARTG